MTKRALSVFLHLGAHGPFEVKAESAGTVEHADDDVCEFLLEVLRIVVPERLQRLADLGVDESENRWDLVVVCPLLWHKNSPTVRAVDLSNLGRENFKRVHRVPRLHARPLLGGEVHGGVVGHGALRARAASASSMLNTVSIP